MHLFIYLAKIVIEKMKSHTSTYIFNYFFMLYHIHIYLSRKWLNRIEMILLRIASKSYIAINVAFKKKKEERTPSSRVSDDDIKIIITTKSAFYASHR